MYIYIYHVHNYVYVWVFAVEVAASVHADANNGAIIESIPFLCLVGVLHLNHSTLLNESATVCTCQSVCRSVC